MSRTLNAANAANPRLHSKPGPNGAAVGGGIYTGTGVWAGLDAFTVNQVVHNSASNQEILGVARAAISLYWQGDDNRKIGFVCPRSR